MALAVIHPTPPVVGCIQLRKGKDMIIRNRRRDDDEDDDDRVSRGRVARDGEIVRVPMAFMDAMQRSVALNAVSAHDVGNPAGHRPGFRLADDDEHRQAAEDAYRERTEWMANAWRKKQMKHHRCAGACPLLRVKRI
jgi:hypothetical protein